MQSMDLREFYRKANEKTRLHHLEKLLEISKFYEMRSAEIQEQANVIIRVIKECANGPSKK
jgi:hypothetical protein